MGRPGLIFCARELCAFLAGLLDCRGSSCFGVLGFTGMLGCVLDFLAGFFLSLDGRCRSGWRS